MFILSLSYIKPISEDQFYKEKIASYEIIEFIPTKYAASFKAFI
jgi:hypothetical protein